MDRWEINGVTLEYDNDSHTYIADGVIVPSVTQIMKVKFGGMYSNVDAETLKRASERGTQIHKDIENYIKGDESLLDITEVRNFRWLMKYYECQPTATEVPLLFMDGGKPKYAGRMDLLLDVKGEMMAIADIKTTSTLNKEYLTYQLNLYRIAFEQSYQMPIDALYGIHLKDGKRKLVEIKIDDLCCLEILGEYDRSLKNE